MIKSPDIFSPSTYKEEKEQYPEFRLKMRSWIGALDSGLLEKINVVENARAEKLIHEEFTPRTINRQKQEALQHPHKLHQRKTVEDNKAGAR